MPIRPETVAEEFKKLVDASEYKDVIEFIEPTPWGCRYVCVCCAVIVVDGDEYLSGGDATEPEDEDDTWTRHSTLKSLWEELVGYLKQE